MIYLYINKNQIKILYLRKTILKQQETAFFEKIYETNLIEKDKEINIDILASSIKETISLATQQLSDKKTLENQVFLVIPQNFFYFFKTDVPFDIAKEAIESFIIDKATSILPVLPEDLSFNYFIKEKNDQKTVNFFGLEKKIIEAFEKALSLIDLKIINIIPDSLAYFKLFEKTLRADKKENILYVVLEKKHIFGYFFDNFGLIENNILFEEINNENNHVLALKKIIKKFEEKNIKINRLIVSGQESENIRQDIFTRDVGVWTNPLKRIVPNFYDPYIKMLMIDKNQVFPILNYDVCFGAFIFSQEEKFSIFKNKNLYSKLGKNFLNQEKRLTNLKKEILIFISSFIISFGLFYLINNFKKINLNFSSTKSIPTPLYTTPTFTPTPTPLFSKEELKIQVLNGSGIPGKASEMKEILRKKGYEEIITGNADNFNYKTTEIKAKKSKIQAISIIKEDLKDYLSVFKETELSEKETPDVIIILGSDFK